MTRTVTVAALVCTLLALTQARADFGAGGGLMGFWGGYARKTTVFLTNASSSNQTWNVLEDWNSTDNEVHVVSHGANGADGQALIISCLGGSGGGGGGYARKANIALTLGGTATYRLRGGNVGSDDATANWFNGTSLAGSSVGIRGTNSSTGASTTNAVGDVTRAGGGGGSGAISGCGGGGGGGAAGPSGVGGAGSNASGSSGGAGGTGDGGNTASNTAGTTWSDVLSSKGSGGGGNGGSSSGNGSSGPLYGGGGGGGGATSLTARNGGAGAQALIVIINNVSLP